MHVNLIMKVKVFIFFVYFLPVGEVIFPSGRRKFSWVKFENALGNGFENIRWGDQTFPLERVLLDLSHGGVLNFFSRFKCFALA